MSHLRMLVVLVIALPLWGCAFMELGELGEVGELAEIGEFRALGGTPLVSESALLGGDIDATLAARLSAAGITDNALFGSEGTATRVVLSVKGRPVLRGIVQATRHEIIVRDQYGSVKVRSQIIGRRLVHFDQHGHQLGYSEISAGRVLHFSETSSATYPTLIGYDEAGPGRVIRHFDAQGRLIGETQIMQLPRATDGALLLAFIPAVEKQASTTNVGTYADPFEYCKAIGNSTGHLANVMNDSRYTGPQFPDEIVNVMMKAKPGTTGPYTWRCMNGDVYGCFEGASSGDCRVLEDSEYQLAILRRYCSAYPNSGYIPFSVNSGPFAQICVGNTPVAVNKYQVDELGYIKANWVKIEHDAPASSQQAEIMTQQK